MRLLLALITTIVLTSGASADFTGEVVGVIDGDTIDVVHDRRSERVRLHGIDAPEKSQTFGKRAKRAASELSFGKEVLVEEHGHDKYGRTLGEVILPDDRSLNREMVRSGYAWRYRKYSNDATLDRLEKSARQSRRGLWKDDDAVPPWEYRKVKRKHRYSNEKQAASENLYP
jgi:endonuclease YncB( thermonuclease family)